MTPLLTVIWISFEICGHLDMLTIIIKRFQCQSMGILLCIFMLQYLMFQVSKRLFQKLLAFGINYWRTADGEWKKEKWMKNYMNTSMIHSLHMSYRVYFSNVWFYDQLITFAFFASFLPLLYSVSLTFETIYYLYNKRRHIRLVYLIFYFSSLSLFSSVFWCLQNAN